MWNGNIMSEEKKEDLGIVHTPCKGCCFAEVDITTEIPTQTGCKLGLLEKYAQKGARIVEATDDESNFFIVANRPCYFTRNKEWADKQETDDLADAVYADISSRWRCAAIVVLDREQNLQDLRVTLEDLYKSERVRCPHHVYILNLNRDIKPYDIRIVIENNKNIGLWSIEHMVQNRAFTRCVDLTASKIKDCSHYVLLRAGKKCNPGGLLQTLYRALYIDLERFTTMLPASDDFHELFTSMRLHNFIGGFKPMKEGKDFVEKVKSIANEEGLEWIIREKSQIVPQ